jgi:hypothetical protein
MRECTGGEGSGSDLGAGSWCGNGAGGGEMEYDGREAGIGKHWRVCGGVRGRWAVAGAQWADSR